MQEDLENRTVTLMVSSSKFTGRTMKSAILHFLSYSKHKVQEHKNVVPHGKQSVKQLTGQHEGVMNLPVGDDVDMRAFDRVARKYSIDYAVRKLPEKEGESKYLIFFKARDKDTLMTAFSECAGNWKRNGREEKQSVLGLLNMFKHKAELDKNRAVHKEISR